MATASTVGAITTHHDAKCNDKPRPLPTVVAAGAIPLGIVALLIGTSNDMDGWIAFALGIAVTAVLWTVAFAAAGASLGRSLGRVGMYLLVIPFGFVGEVWIGLPLALVFVAVTGIESTAILVAVYLTAVAVFALLLGRWHHRSLELGHYGPAAPSWVPADDEDAIEPDGTKS